jgi:hypothetical protein
MEFNHGDTEGMSFNHEISEIHEHKMSKETEFWIGLETMASGEGLLADWEWAFGTAFGLIKPFLRMTEKRSEWHACREKPPCGCSHEIREIGDELLACCTCPPDECEPFKVTPEDLILYELDVERFESAVCEALGFASANAGTPGQRIGQIAMYAATAAPVYFGRGSSDVLLRELGKLSAFQDGPFLLLTPTGWHCSQAVDALLRQLGAGHVSLSSVVTPGPGAFRAVPAAEPVLGEFERRVASLRDRGATLRNIHQEIASVRRDFGEMRSAKERLEKMQAEGMFAFIEKVDAKSFKVFCTILARGDVAKASRELGLGDSTVRDVLREWSGRGDAYRTMLDLVRWRKKVGRVEKLRLNEAVLHERAATTDYPGLLSDVLEGLLSMTHENWKQRSEELTEMLGVV